MTSAKTSCSVCSDPLDEADAAFCGECGNAYHLNQRQDRPGKDCGQVWINEDHLALEFACNSCLNPPADPATLDDILDLPEAALAAGMPPEAVIAAANDGRLAHRKTSSGTYLFQRRDVLTFGERR